MAELRAPEQNRLLGQLARMLRTTEGDIAAPEFLPKSLDVMGLVRQLMLPSAETVEKMSYGDPLFRMPTQSNIPITADREYLADVAGMIPFGAPAARPSARAMQDLVRQIQTEPPTGAITPRASLLDQPAQSVGESNKTKQFLEMAEKGRLQMAKDRSSELKDLKEGKSKFAELSLNWDDPQTYDLVDEYAKDGFKTKVIDRGGRNVTYLYKNEKDIKDVLSATTPADYGRAYGYSDEDIARFYLERGLGPEDFFEDMSVVEAPKFEMPSFAASRPETEGDIDQIYDFVEQQAKKAGYRVESGASNISNSRYLTITEDLPDDDIRGIELRISDHGDRHPFSDATEGKISIDPSRGGTDLEAALYELQEKGFNLLR
jgi:hypothetical protein